MEVVELDLVDERNLARHGVLPGHGTKRWETSLARFSGGFKEL
jgi:hypothetical protein